MKSLFLATAAVAAFAAAPALAQTAPTGSVGVTWNQVDVESADAVDGYAIDAFVAGPTYGEWTVSFGAKGAWVDGDLDDSKTFSGQAHVTRDFGGLRAGGFVAVSDATKGSTLWTVGAEAQKYFDKATVTGVLSYGTSSDLDLWSAGVDGGYYITPNLRVNANASYNKIDVAGVDTDAYGYGVGAEYQLAAAPFSVYGGWDRTTLDEVSLDVDTATVGIRFNFGGGSLQQRERAGASLNRTVGNAANLASLGL